MDIFVKQATKRIYVYAFLERMYRMLQNALKIFGSRGLAIIIFSTVPNAPHKQFKIVSHAKERPYTQHLNTFKWMVDHKAMLDTHP